MAKQIRTEAERRATPAPKVPNGANGQGKGGQRVSLERGSHTRSKKNPGKRASSGG